MRRFVSIPADRLRADLGEVAAGVRGVGGTARWLRVGREEVLEFAPPGSPVRVRVFTTLDGREVARDRGDDAVRVVLLAGDAPVARVRRLLRTAPGGVEDRVGAFLERLRTALRDAYRRARVARVCPDCGRALVPREGPRGAFLGCLGFPACRRTAPIGAPIDPLDGSEYPEIRYDRKI